VTYFGCTATSAPLQANRNGRAARTSSSATGRALPSGVEKLQRRDRMPDRVLIDTGNDKRYVLRDEQGRFKDVVDVGRSLSQDQRKGAKADSKPGQGDRGDRKSS
jgi:hypothetical protein